MWNNLQVLTEPGPLRDPVLLISVSTSNPQFRLLYSQARELGKLLIRKMAVKQIAIFYSSAMTPEIRIHRNGTASLLSNNFYHISGEKRDYILFAGHASPVEGEYEYAETVLEFAKKLGVKEVISIGARWSEPVLSPLEPPKVLGFASDEEGIEKLKAADVTLLKNEAAYYFANLIVPLAKLHGMRGYKLSVDHGEPSPHPKSLISILTVLSKMIDLNVDQADLFSQSKELAEAIKKAEKEGLELDENGEPIDTGRKSQQSDDIYR